MVLITFENEERARGFVQEIEKLSSKSKVGNDKSVEVHVLKNKEGIVFLDTQRLRAVVLDYRSNFDMCLGWETFLKTMAMSYYYPKWNEQMDIEYGVMQGCLDGWCY